MKKLLLFLFPVIFFSCLTKSDPDSTQVIEKDPFFDALYSSDSLKDLQIDYFNTIAISGNFNGKEETFIEYNSIFEEIEKDREAIKDYPEIKKELNYQLELNKREKRGGCIDLNLTREFDYELANAFFEVTIKDKKENILFIGKDSLSDRTDFGWNGFRESLKLIYINVRLPENFYVYVEDKFKNETFKFEVVPVYYSDRK